MVINVKMSTVGSDSIWIFFEIFLSFGRETMLAWTIDYHGGGKVYKTGQHIRTFSRNFNK